MKSNEKLNELYSILNALRQKEAEVRACGEIETIQTLSDTIEKLELYIENRRKKVYDEINL